MTPIEQAREALTDVLANLVAAHSLLSRSPKTAAPSNKMFDTMLSDYAKSIKRGREALARLSPSTPVDGVGAEAVGYGVFRNSECIGFVGLGEEFRLSEDTDERRPLYAAPLASPEAEARLRERVVGGTRTFALSAMVSKSIPGGRTQSSMVGYRRCNTEDEARGSFILSVEKEKPDFSIDQLLCIEIPAEARLAQAEGGPVVTEALVEAAQDIINTMSSTYQARNGRRMGIQADDGEKCWIVHSDQIAALEAALHPQSAAGEEGKV